MDRATCAPCRPRPSSWSRRAWLAGTSTPVVRKRALDAEGARVLAVAVIATMAHFPLTALARSYGVAMLRRP